MIKNDSAATSKIFKLLDNSSSGYITQGDIVDQILKHGISSNDIRLKSVFSRDPQLKLDLKTFSELMADSSLLRRTLSHKLVISDFDEFSRVIKDIYESTKTISGGQLPSYIPPLAKVDPQKYAIAICTVDGQRFCVGDAAENFCLQSVCKTINYCIVQEELGEKVVHQHVGQEPSGVGYNVLVLNAANLPHNPFINAGAIMVCSLLKNQWESADRYDYVMKIWKELCGNEPGFDNTVYLGEKSTADTNFALAHYMKAKNAFPLGTNLMDTLELYFQCCSIELSAKALSVAAASLANGGVNPFSGNRIFQPRTVRNCVTLMYSCGMYDYSGQFAFKVGLPAKSGVSGALMMVIPNLMGIVIWSPPLDLLGNSVRGLAFCEELMKRFTFRHQYSVSIKKT